MMKLVWVSRHKLTPENHTILKKAFGNYEIVQFSETVNDVKELIDFANEHGADGYVVVFPPHLIQQLLAKDKRPVYRFIVERKINEKGEAEFTPTGLERIVEIKVVTERIV